MRAAVLADTGPVYAAIDARDEHYFRARDDLKRLERERLAVVVAYPILLESYALVVRRLGIPRAHAWIHEMHDGATFINPTSDIYNSAIATVQDYRDQPLTLVDAVLSALSQRIGLPIWTYDHHLDILNAEVWR